MFRVRSTLVGVASLALLGACATPATVMQFGTSPGPQGGAPPAEPGEFHDQQIVFEPRAPYATTAVDEQLALLGQSGCVDGTVTDYLIDLRTPPDDARCTL